MKGGAGVSKTSSTETAVDVAVAVIGFNRRIGYVQDSKAAQEKFMDLWQAVQDSDEERCLEILAHSAAKTQQAFLEAGSRYRTAEMAEIVQRMRDVLTRAGR